MSLKKILFHHIKKTIMNLTFMEREIALEKAKVALEAAFTPRIKEMLSKQLQQEKDDESTGD